MPDSLTSLITFSSDLSKSNSGENFAQYFTKFFHESTLSNSSSSRIAFNVLQLAVTFLISTSLGVELRVCGKYNLLVVPNIDGGTVGLKDPPGTLTLGQSGGKCLAQTPMFFETAHGRMFGKHLTHRSSSSGDVGNP